MKHLLLLLTTGLGTVGALGQTPTLTALQPTRHAAAAPRSTVVRATYSQPVSGGTVRVFSRQRGRLAGNMSTGGNALTLTPTQPLRPGEMLMATVTPASGSPAPRQVFAFTAAVGGGSGRFTATPTAVMSENTPPKALADMDGDGDLDMLSTTPGFVKLRLNNGTGSFGTATSFAVNDPGKALTTADVDGDGDADLVAALGNTAFLWRQIATGFDSRQDIDLGGTFGASTAALALADVDGDGDLDLLATRAYTATNVLVAVRLNDGTGTFSGTGSVPVGTNGNITRDLAVGDLDNDGDMDLLTCAGPLAGSSGELALRLNDGTGTFSSSPAVSLDINPETLTLGDMDNDGDLDVLAGSQLTPSVSVLLNGGSGQFGLPVRLSVGSAGTGVNQLSLGDVDADGDLDVLAGAATATAGTLVMFRNNGNGSFAAASSVGAMAGGLDGGRQALGDLDNDGDLDVVVGAGAGLQAGVGLYLNDAQTLASRTPAGLPPLALWPNPAHQQVQVLAPAGATAVQLSDALGRPVRAVPASGAGRPTAVPLTGLPAGMYLLRAGAATGRVAVE